MEIFIIAIVAITTFGGIVSMWIKAKHGYPIEDRRDRAERVRKRLRSNMRRMLNDDEPSDQRKIELLSAENDQLNGKIGRLEERLRVLERIATDPAERTAREIDALRNSVD